MHLIEMCNVITCRVFGLKSCRLLLWRSSWFCERDRHESSLLSSRSLSCTCLRANEAASTTIPTGAVLMTSPSKQEWHGEPVVSTACRLGPRAEESCWWTSRASAAAASAGEELSKSPTRPVPCCVRKALRCQMHQSFTLHTLSMNSMNE